MRFQRASNPKQYEVWLKFVWPFVSRKKYDLMLKAATGDAEHWKACYVQVLDKLKDTRALLEMEKSTHRRDSTKKGKSLSAKPKHSSSNTPSRRPDSASVRRKRQ